MHGLSYTVQALGLACSVSAMAYIYSNGIKLIMLAQAQSHHVPLCDACMGGHQMCLLAAV